MIKVTYSIGIEKLAKCINFVTKDTIGINSKIEFSAKT